MGASHSLASMQAAAHTLTDRNIPHADQEAWKQLWSTPTTPSELWQCLPDALLAQVRDKQPANFASLLHRLVAHVAQVVAASKGDLAAVKPLAPVANTFTVNATTTRPKGAEDPVTPAAASTLLNCVRILTRCVSLLVEQPRSRWFADYLWGGELPLPAALAGTPVDAAIARGMFGERTLGEAILLLLLDLLFTEGFSVHPSLATNVPNKLALRHNGVQLDRLWEVSISASGHAVAGPPNLPNVSQMLQPSVGWSCFDSNRQEVLRLLMVCFSEDMMLPPNRPHPASASVAAAPAVDAAGSVAKAVVPNRFLREFVSESSACAQWTPTLYWSLLNLVLNYQPQGSAMVQLPYSYALTLYTDHREPLVEVALHFLLILLDYRHGISTAAVQPTQVAEVKASQRTPTATEASSSSPPLATVALAGEAALAPVQASNVFHAIFTEMSNGACLTAIYTNLTRLLMNALAAQSTYLPNSLRRMYAFQELLILVWKLLDECPAAVPFILHPPSSSAAELDILHLVTPLLYFMHESRRDSSQQGLMYSCVFVLLKLSGDREFSVALNRAVYSVPSLAHVQLFSLLDLPAITEGTYADCLVATAHKLIVSSPTHLDALLKVMLTLLCNVSPYITRLSLFASIKLLSLFELFSSQAFVNANSTNHQYATLMIEMLNNMVQYQYGGNSNLVYALIRRAQSFFQLGRLAPLPGATSPTPTVQEQQRSLQQATMAELTTSTKVASSASTTIEMAERPSAASSAPATTPTAAAPSPAAPSTSFAPTPQWVNSWKRQLPLEPIFRLLEFFEPKVMTQLQGSATVDEARVISMIASTTLVGVLPVPHPIVVRKYLPNQLTDSWFSVFQFGVIFLRQQSLSTLNLGVASGAPLWNPRAIKLFVIAGSEADTEARARAIATQLKQVQALALKRQAELVQEQQQREQVASSVGTTASPSSGAEPSASSQWATPPPGSDSAPTGQELPYAVQADAAAQPAENETAPAQAEEPAAVELSQLTVADEQATTEPQTDAPAAQPASDDAPHTPPAV